MDATREDNSKARQMLDAEGLRETLHAFAESQGWKFHDVEVKTLRKDGKPIGMDASLTLTIRR